MRKSDTISIEGPGYVDSAGVLLNGEPLRPRVLWPNGGILSTAADMATWELALAGGRSFPARRR